MGSPPAVFTSRRTVVAGLALHERVAGAAGPGAPAVVLVHGLGVSGRYLLPLAGVLARTSRVSVPDLPGFGLSERPERPLDVPALAAALAGLLDAAGGEPASFVANSLGCQVAIELAVARPELVDRLVLVGPTVDAAARRYRWQLARFALLALREPPSLVRLVLGEYLGAGIGRCLTTVGYALADRPEEKLPLVRAPTLVVCGEHDTLCPRPWAEEIVRLLPDGRLELVHGEAHAVHYSSPELVAWLVDEFRRA